MAGLNWSEEFPTGGGSARGLSSEVFGGGELVRPSEPRMPQGRSAPPTGNSVLPSSPRSEAPTNVANAQHVGPYFQPRNDRDRSEYEDMRWRDVASSAGSNLLPSAGNAIKGVYDAVVNYEETGAALADLGRGVKSKVTGALGFGRNEDAEASVDALADFYKDRYGSMAAFKETLAEDPFSIGMDVASVAPVVGPAARVGGLGPQVSGALARTASLADPITLATTAAGAAGRTIAKPALAMGRVAQAPTSGVPMHILRIAQDTGQSGTPAQRAAFHAFAGGKGDHLEIARAATAAVDELKAAANAEYVARRGALTTAPLPMRRIIDAVNDMKARVDPHTLGLFPELHSSIAEMERQIHRVMTSPDPAARSAQGLDRLKRSLNDEVSKFSRTPHAGNLGEVPKAVRETISQYDSGYAKMMDMWDNWRQEMLNYQQGLGASDRVSETSRLARLLSAAKSDKKISLLDQLAKTRSGHALPQMLAGTLIHQAHPSYMQGMGGVGLGLLTGNPLHSVGALVAASPRASGYTSYLGGMALGSRMPNVVPGAVKNVTSQIGNEAAWARPERRAGGRVMTDHDRLADKLVGAADRAKKGINRETEPLLQAHDDHIAQALELANRSI